MSWIEYMHANEMVETFDSKVAFLGNVIMLEAIKKFKDIHFILYFVYWVGIVQLVKENHNNCENMTFDSRMWSRRHVLADDIKPLISTPTFSISQLVRTSYYPR
jgi:hypothetical protein